MPKPLSLSPASKSIAYWLVKTEPDVFSIHDLAKSKKKTTYWDGVRNYQARNFMRDQMKLGHRVLVYHSNADPSCVVERLQSRAKLILTLPHGIKAIRISTPSRVRRRPLGSWSTLLWNRFLKSRFRWRS